MPAPAVIPAPIAYINAAAVKGYVVECGVLGSFCRFGGLSHPYSVIDGNEALLRFFTPPLEWPRRLGEEFNKLHMRRMFGRPSLSL